MNASCIARQVIGTISRAGLLASACVLTHTASPALADQTVAARQAPATILLEVPKNPDHAAGSELAVVSFEYDAAAERLTYTRGYDSAVAGSFLLQRTDTPVPVAARSLLKSLEVREADGTQKIFRRVTFHGVHVIGIAPDGNDRRLSFTADSVTVR